MAEENQGEEKTEEPSGKRLKEAHDKGQIARSRDFNAILILLGTSVAFLELGEQLAIHFINLMKESFEFNSDLLLTTSVTFERLFYLSQYGIKAVIPILIIIFLLALTAPMMVGGWNFSLGSMGIKFSRLNPISGFAKMFNVKNLVEMFKAFLKVVLITSVSLSVLKVYIPKLLALGHASVDVAINEGTYIVIKSFAIITSSLIIIALIDVPFQIYQHKKELKMTKQEVKDEYKNSEGKPEVKQAIRRAQMEMSRRRMMAEVPKADVVLTNPTHYAVAISYKNKKSKAPIVVAKGKDLIAFQISKIAHEQKVPIVVVPPLTRAIYFSTKLNKEIPRGLYVAVAQVLAYIFQLKNTQNYDYKPSILQNVPIPPDLARAAEEELNE